MNRHFKTSILWKPNVKKLAEPCRQNEEFGRNPSEGMSQKRAWDRFVCWAAFLDLDFFVTFFIKKKSKI